MRGIGLLRRAKHWCVMAAHTSPPRTWTMAGLLCAAARDESVEPAAAERSDFNHRGAACGGGGGACRTSDAAVCVTALTAAWLLHPTLLLVEMPQPRSGAAPARCSRRVYTDIKLCYKHEGCRGAASKLGLTIIKLALCAGAHHRFSKHRSIGKLFTKPNRAIGAPSYLVPDKKYISV